jgi:ATP-binding cassette subfamily C protein
MKTGSLFRHALVRRGRDLAATLATTGLLGILGLAVPVATGYMIDQVIPDHEIGRLVEMGIILAVFAFTSFILTLVGALAYARLEAHLGITLQTGLMDRMLRLPMIFFRDHSAGDLASRVGAIALIQRLISAASANAILSGIFSLLSLLLLFVYDARLALWASVAVAIYFVGSAIIMFLRVREERPVAAISGEINSVLLQLILGVSKIRLAAAEDRAFSRWAILFARENRHRLRAELLGAAQGTLNQVLGLSGLVLLAIAIGKPSAQPSLIALGSFAAMLTAYQRFASGITQASQALTQLLAVQPQIERLRPLLAQAAEAAERLDPPGTLSGAIEVSHLSFRYTPDGPIILEDVCLEASPGEMIALVGPSGSGKSTLLRLLLGFETPRNGAILFDGKALVGLDKAAVRRQMGVVMQNSQPMPGSLYENIAGTTGCSLDEAWEAAERAGLADDIRAMPMGMHTVVLEGGGALSGGQMQRLMIARAIVSKPRILLLDEATSALDNRVQAVVTESLDRLSITRVVVAHRLSTVINADRIYVLERGRITESGSYLELMALGGVFAQLAERQMA